MQGNIDGEENARLGEKNSRRAKKMKEKNKKKDGPGPVMVSDTLCPAVHILGT